MVYLNFRQILRAIVWGTGSVPSLQVKRASLEKIVKETLDEIYQERTVA